MNKDNYQRSRDILSSPYVHQQNYQVIENRKQYLSPFRGLQGGRGSQVRPEIPYSNFDSRLNVRDLKDSLPRESDM